MNTQPINPSAATIIAIEGIDGAGKTTIANKLVEAFLEGGSAAKYCRLSPSMGQVLRSVVDKPSNGALRYQDKIDPEFRYAIYLLEAVTQFHYMADTASEPVTYVFDRWIQTYDAYCVRPTRYSEWFEAMRHQIPKPDVLIYLNIPVSIAASRLREREDWTALHWSTGELVAELALRKKLYEAATWPDTKVVVPAGGSLVRVLQSVRNGVFSLTNGIRTEHPRH